MSVVNKLVSLVVLFLFISFVYAQEHEQGSGAYSDIDQLKPEQLADALLKGQITDPSVIPPEKLADALEKRPDAVIMIRDNTVLVNALSTKPSLLSDVKIITEVDKRVKTDVSMVNGNPKIMQAWAENNGFKAQSGARIKAYDGHTVATDGKHSVRFSPDSIPHGTGLQIMNDGSIQYINQQKKMNVILEGEVQFDSQSGDLVVRDGSFIPIVIESNAGEYRAVRGSPVKCRGSCSLIVSDDLTFFVVGTAETDCEKRCITLKDLEDVSIKNSIIRAVPSNAESLIDGVVLMSENEIIYDSNTFLLEGVDVDVQKTPPRTKFAGKAIRFYDAKGHNVHTIAFGAGGFQTSKEAGAFQTSRQDFDACIQDGGSSCFLADPATGEIRVKLRGVSISPETVRKAGARQSPIFGTSAQINLPADDTYNSVVFEGLVPLDKASSVTLRKEGQAEEVHFDYRGFNVVNGDINAFSVLIGGEVYNARTSSYAYQECKEGTCKHCQEGECVVVSSNFGQRSADEIRKLKTGLTQAMDEVKTMEEFLAVTNIVLGVASQRDFDSYMIEDLYNTFTKNEIERYCQAKFLSCYVYFNEEFEKQDNYAARKTMAKYLSLQKGKEINPEVMPELQKMARQVFVKRREHGGFYYNAPISSDILPTDISIVDINKRMTEEVLDAFTKEAENPIFVHATSEQRAEVSRVVGKRVKAQFELLRQDILLRNAQKRKEITGEADIAERTREQEEAKKRLENVRGEELRVKKKVGYELLRE